MLTVQVHVDKIKSYKKKEKLKILKVAFSKNYNAIFFTSSYFAVVVYKVIVLMIEELGGTHAFLNRFSSKPFKISTGPCCCCCLCLPWVPMSRQIHPVTENKMQSFVIFTILNNHHLLYILSILLNGKLHSCCSVFAL